MNIADTNPLLTLTKLNIHELVEGTHVNLHNLKEVESKHIRPAIELLFAEYKAVVDNVVQSAETPSWDNVMAVLDRMLAKFSSSISSVVHLVHVCDSLDFREAYEEILPIYSNFFAELAQNKQLYEKILTLSKNAEDLNNVQRYILDQELLSFKLSGVDLPDDKQAKLKDLRAKLANISHSYGNNILDATNNFTKHIEDLELLAGIPELTLTAAKQNAALQNLNGWLFGLDAPTYTSIITYAHNRELRKTFYEAFVTRASELGDNKPFDNTENINNILNIRQEIARLVGFDNFAEYSLATKMAKSSAEVLSFLRDIAEKAKPFANTELKLLQAFAKDKSSLQQLHSYDLPYYSNLYQQEVFGIDQEQVREYFVEHKVVAGMLDVASKLFNISFVEVTKSFATVLYHETVKAYAVLDLNKNVLGWFITDLYARQTKRGGAWMDSWVNRFKDKNKLEVPVVLLNCNFAPRAEGGLLTHDDVVTLFHEFGHGLHGLLTTVDYLGAAGMNNVPWDGVELPSQMFENWAWQYEVIVNISGHYKTGESLPFELFNKLLQTKNYNSGLFLLRQIEFAMFDMLVHKENNIVPGQVSELLMQVRNEVAVVLPPEYNRFQHSFNHIFNGGYAAGYYSYLWADVLSCDAFALFYPNKLFDPTLGIKFKQEVLAVGGSRDFMQSYEAFSGRKPKVESLLMSYGLI